MKILILALLALNLTAAAAPTAEVQCLAMNIHQEARGEPYLGRLAVAQVTLNRSRDPRFHENICDVVYARRQFSWTVNPNTYEPPRPEDILMAGLVIAGRHELSEFRALYFHSTKINPGWKHKKAAKIGNHIFYTSR